MLISENTLYLSKTEAKALLTHASTDIARIHMAAVMIESGSSTRMVATDGHRLAVAECPGQLTHGGLLGREDLERAVKVLGSKEVLAIVPNGGAHMTLGIAYGEGGPVTRGVQVKLLDSNYVPWQQVLPGADKAQKTGVGVLGINADYLGDLGQVAKACGKRNGSVRLCLPQSDLDPVRWECAGNGATWEGCVMPVRL